MYKKYNVLYHSSGVKIELISKFSCDNADSLKCKKKEVIW